MSTIWAVKFLEAMTSQIKKRSLLRISATHWLHSAVHRLGKRITQVENKGDTRKLTLISRLLDLQRAMRFISIFKGLGCRFVLDDFGKGVSSYTYLKNLPVDLLKIEGEFVRRMLDDPIEAAIVDSINQVGHVVGLETIAECVETEEVFEAVRRAGIDYAQGYWLARPQPLIADELLAD